MNRLHRRYCRSDRWTHQVEQSLLPWVLRDVGLGDDVLEVGPGPGLTTDVLRRRVSKLTAIEIDDDLASALEVPAAGLQDRLPAEVHRVRCPCGRFLGSDSTRGIAFRLAHVLDTLVLVKPDTLATRLEHAGFDSVKVGNGRGAFRFRAVRPNA